MRGEANAFADGFDGAFVLRGDSEKLLGHEVPLYSFTDSKQFLDSIIRGQGTTEKMLMIVVLAARDAYNYKEINHIALGSSDDDSNSRISKVRGNGALVLFWSLEWTTALFSNG